MDYEAGEEIVVFRTDKTDLRKRIEFTGWYCGVSEGLHVYILLIDGKPYRHKTQPIESCRLADLADNRGQWDSMFVNENPLSLSSAKE